MTIEVKVPVLPESVPDATVLNWHKKIGDEVKRNENLVDLETDKVVLEVPSPTDGVLESILIKSGATVKANEVLAILNEKKDVKTPKKEENQKAVTAPSKQEAHASPGVRRFMGEHDVKMNEVVGTGKGGKIVKEDVLKVMENAPSKSEKSVEPSIPTITSHEMTGERVEKRVPMTRLRARIAERLVQAQHSAAMLTTFNEINLLQVMNVRNKYKDIFEKKYHVKLGFMSFFTKAVIGALRAFPAVNASLDGNDIIYHGYYDIGIAVSTERGLVVPVLRNAEQMTIAEIERAINDYAIRARDNKLGIEEMKGGTFTITNGGVFGSLCSTPIINPPQTGILGMHKIEERPVVENGEIVIRPMMYVALSYDHRLIDGKESVQFLVTVKQLLEDPSRMILEI